MIHELYIFGSTVRGEVTETSDVDVLVIPIDGQQIAYPPSWSVYSKETIESYYREGRLFAWHLYLEAKRIFPGTGSSYLSALGEPSPYVTAEEDIADLESIVREALQEIDAGTDSLIYELGLVYTAIRDIAMSASWILLDQPSFSQYAPYSLPIICPLSLEAYRGTMLARHQSTRGSTSQIDLDTIAEQIIASPLLDWVSSIRRVVCPTRSLAR